MRFVLLSLLLIATIPGCGVDWFPSNDTTLVTITTTTLPAATVGGAYSQTLAATGGTTPYSWSITAGSLPAGLTLDAAGKISGTPTTAGSASFTVMAADSASSAKSDTQSFTLQTIEAVPLTIAPETLPAATVGVAYSQTLTGTGGITPYTWGILSGTLPAGLSLAEATGVISGTPTAAGTATFTVMIRDSLASSAGTSRDYSLTVNAANTVSVATATLPDAPTGLTYTQTLAASGGSDPYAWALLTGTLPVGLALTPATGVISGTPTAVTDSTAGSGTFTFTVKVTDSSATPTIASKELSIAVPTSGRLYDSTNKVYAEGITATVVDTSITVAIARVRNTDSIEHAVELILVVYEDNGAKKNPGDFQISGIIVPANSEELNVSDTSDTLPAGNWRIKQVNIIR